MLQQSLEFDKILQQIVLGEFGAWFLESSTPFLGLIDPLLWETPILEELPKFWFSDILKSDFGITFKLTGGTNFGFEAICGLGLISGFFPELIFSISPYIFD